MGSCPPTTHLAFHSGSTWPRSVAQRGLTGHLVKLPEPALGRKIRGWGAGSKHSLRTEFHCQRCLRRTSMDHVFSLRGMLGFPGRLERLPPMFLISADAGGVSLQSRRALSSASVQPELSQVQMQEGGNHPWEKAGETSLPLPEENLKRTWGSRCPRS